MQIHRVFCRVLIAALVGLPSIGARADRIEIAPVLPRAGVAVAVLRLEPVPASAQTVVLRWTDALGRLVDERTLAVPARTARLSVRLDLARAAVADNALASTRGAERAEARFVATPPAAGWTNWRTIAWQVRGPAQLAAIAAMDGGGPAQTGGQVAPTREGPLTAASVATRVAPYLATGERFFVENIATDLYAAYHRWLPDRAVNAAFVAAQVRHKAAPADPSVWLRAPGLDDPAWRARIAARLAAHVRAFGGFAPLYYNLGDETGIADLSANWDFDLAPEALDGLRAWLQNRYGSLAALNAQWGSGFATWSAVTPVGTDAARAKLRAGDGNLSGWGDFKEYMDVAFARSVRAGTDALHRADPAARGAIEGAQMPGWGGYDYSRLARSVDVMEAYDYGSSIDIARAMNPALILLTTSFEGGPRENWRLWHTALQGARGVVVWDETGDFAAADGKIGARGRSVAASLAELSGGVGDLLIAARPDPGTVGVVYSPASFRVNWILDHRDDDGWAMRSAEDELAENAIRAAVRHSVAALQAAGIGFHWISPDELEGPARAGEKAVLLPHVLALSERAATALRARATGGEHLIGDIAPGAWDEHARRRHAGPALPVRLVAEMDEAGLASALEAAGVAPPARLEGAVPVGTQMRLLRVGASRIIAVELPAPASGPADPAEPAAVKLRLVLPVPMWVRDLHSTLAARRGETIDITLSATRPALIGLSGEEPAAPVLLAPAAAMVGEAVHLRVGGAVTPGQRLELVDPSAQTVAAYGGSMPPGGIVWHPVVSDKKGCWRALLVDPLSGATAERGVCLR